MSLWTDRILGEFPSDLARLWIAADPDDVLLDEHILSELRGRGFEVLPFEDAIAFRADYEERWRQAWGRGEAEPAKALVLHLQSAEPGNLPDWLAAGIVQDPGVQMLDGNIAFDTVATIEECGLLLRLFIDF